ncbi:dihydropteroate synthase [Haloferula sp. BvORR071]|uniref:dihydropteroate synthase n=1 Tax=Haloferula sp. BvORR071 TaxID=1396141 RepID=UPI00224100AE|nr:dihydropteroate synthase [Haloferula sp. BvORR071]
MRSGLECGVRWCLPGREILFPRRPLVMGIVNVNDDSFSGDGTLDISAALEQARRQSEEGADIIDVGAESARTNRAAIAVEEEVRRFRAFLEAWPEALTGAVPRDEAQVWPPVLAANTWRPEVVEKVLPLGVEFLNDMGGLPDERNARLCAEVGASLLIMHSVGEPKVPHFHQQWGDVMGAMEAFFEEKVAMATAAGLPKEALVLDPGIDFAKQRDDNLRVFREMERLQRFEVPLLVPVSRKTVIGEVLGIAEPKERDAGTVACIAAAVRRGAGILRVHDVRAAWQAVKMLAALG